MERNNIPDELQTIWNEAKACIERDDYDKAIEIYTKEYESKWTPQFLM